MHFSPRRSQIHFLFFLVQAVCISFAPAQVQPQSPVNDASGNSRPAVTNASSSVPSSPTAESYPAISQSNDSGNPALHSSPASANGDYILSVGDTIELVVYREPDLGIRSKIGNDGMVQLPLLGEIKLAGMAVRSASSLIRQKYDADYLVNPQVYLDVVSYHPRKFSVGGQVGRPGSYDFSGGDAPGLLDAIGLAGGFLSSADRGNVVVKRHEGNSIKTITLNAKDPSSAGVENFQVEPGDDITVGEGKFTIIGQVGRPGAYDFGDSDSLDLLEAIGMAGGFTRIADRGHIVVKRREGDGVRTIKVNAKKLSSDGVDHFEIKTGDVINVGESWY